MYYHQSVKFSLTLHIYHMTVYVFMCNVHHVFQTLYNYIHIADKHICSFCVFDGTLLRMCVLWTCAVLVRMFKSVPSDAQEENGTPEQVGKIMQQWELKSFFVNS